MVLVMSPNTDLFWQDPGQFVENEIRRVLDVASYVPEEPRVFSWFYKTLRRRYPDLTELPLTRVKSLGKPLAHSSEIVQLPLTHNIVHCCNPEHLAMTHFLTVPFFKYVSMRPGGFDPSTGGANYLITIQRGIDLFGAGFYPFTREVTMYMHGPLCFELDTGELSIFFKMIPLSAQRHLIEIALYYTGEVEEWQEPFMPKIGEFFVRTSLGEDSQYLEEIDNADNAVFNSSDQRALELPGLQLYRQHYSDQLRVILNDAYEIANSVIEPSSR